MLLHAQMNYLFNWDKDRLLLGLGLLVRPILARSMLCVIPAVGLPRNFHVILDRWLCPDLDAFAVLYRACAYDAVARALASHFIVRHVLSIRASKLIDAR